jgi:hypothetical protein
MRMRNLMVWSGIAVALAALIFLVALVMILFDTAEHNDQLAALAAILGGAIGAAGTAIAVYLTLAAQRADEAEKVESTLRMEAAEFGRLAVGLLGVCEEILANRAQIPVKDLPAIMSMPEAVVYKATADRISRLSYGALFVVLHARIAEAISTVKMMASKTTPDAFRDRILPSPMVDGFSAKLLLTAWFDVCEIARTILRPGAKSHDAAAAAIAQCLADLDAGHIRVGPLVKSEEETPAPPIQGVTK